MIWFTSDTHFGHRNIIRYCNRPFKNVWEMNHQLIENWNSVVHPDDVVYHLGDFSFLPPKQTREIIDALNGEIRVILGNHDAPNNLVHDRVRVAFDAEIDIGGDKVVLTHYPEKAIKSQSGLGFCGHIHTQWRSWKNTDNQIAYNVGTDAWDYHPISIRDIQLDLLYPKNRVVGEWKDSYHGN